MRTFKLILLILILLFAAIWAHAAGIREAAGGGSQTTLTGI